MPVWSYEEIKRRLERAFDLCRSLGLDPVRTRFIDYAKRIDQLIAALDARRAGQPAEPLEQLIEQQQLEYMLSLTESTEFGEVATVLADLEPRSLRNVLFELSIAAYLRRAGFIPELGEHPDLWTDVHGLTVGFEESHT